MHGVYHLVVADSPACHVPVEGGGPPRCGPAVVTDLMWVACHGRSLTPWTLANTTDLGSYGGPHFQHAALWLSCLLDAGKVASRSRSRWDGAMRGWRPGAAHRFTCWRAGSPQTTDETVSSRPGFHTFVHKNHLASLLKTRPSPHPRHSGSQSPGICISEKSPLATPVTLRNLPEYGVDSDCGWDPEGW